VIKTLIEYYPHYKCSNFYKGLINAENILEKIKVNYNFGGHENLVDFRKITTESNLSQIKDFTDIKSISIKNSKLVIDLSIFSYRNFQYLTELILINDQISDISPLFSCEFPALEKLDLENNNIDNTIIQFLKTKKFPELTFLNLFMNKITSLEIFEVIKNFKNLTTFYIGENKLDIHNNTKDYELPEKLEILGITGNFDGEDANFIEKLGIENLKVLYLSRNNISSLKYLKKFKFKRLEKIWAITNEITNIKEIMNINSKENLKIINLKQNKINNFKELFNIIGDFPILEKIVLIDNNISEKEVIEMKKRIKEKYKRDLNIEVTKLFYNIYKI
jgi:Leucine-rich repeat (LRR) protein